MIRNSRMVCWLVGFFMPIPKIACVRSFRLWTQLIFAFKAMKEKLPQKPTGGNTVNRKPGSKSTIKYVFSEKDHGLDITCTPLKHQFQGTIRPWWYFITVGVMMPGTSRSIGATLQLRCLLVGWTSVGPEVGKATLNRGSKGIYPLNTHYQVVQSDLFIP